MNLEEMSDEQLHRLLIHTWDVHLRNLPDDEFDALTAELKLRYGAAVAGLDQAAQWFRDRGEEPPTVPKVQSGTTVAVQSAEAGAVSETDIDTQTVTAPLVTIAGQNDVSLQIVDAGDRGARGRLHDELRRAPRRARSKPDGEHVHARSDGRDGARLPGSYERGIGTVEADPDLAERVPSYRRSLMSAPGQPPHRRARSRCPAPDGVLSRRTPSGR
jgi:hypothetical protein